jgi:hypothetical protein
MQSNSSESLEHLETQKKGYKMKTITALKTLALFPVLFASVSQANLGGFSDQYNRGSFACVDAQGELEGHFTFGAAQANLVIKGQPVALECGSARNAAPEEVAVFRGQYFKPVDVCVGQSAKGNVVIATSNSMGNVQINAVLLGSRGERLAAATLNCESETSNGSKW